MPAPSKRPSPPARMVELLADWKRILLDVDQRELTMEDFRRAWERCWEIIVLEHGWAHATRLRRSMRQVQDETREECCAAFLDLPTPFAAAAARMDEIATSAGVTLAPAQLGRALLASIVLVELPEGDDRADAAALAAREFMGLQDRPKEIAA